MKKKTVYVHKSAIFSISNDDAAPAKKKSCFLQIVNDKKLVIIVARLKLPITSFFRDLKGGEKRRGSLKVVKPQALERSLSGLFRRRSSDLHVSFWHHNYRNCDSSRRKVLPKGSQLRRLHRRKVAQLHLPESYLFLWTVHLLIFQIALCFTCGQSIIRPRELDSDELDTFKEEF